MSQNRVFTFQDRNLLGRSGISVSPLCFGTLALSPLQTSLPAKEGARLLRYAFEKGINFLDTAELYHNYHIIRQALEGWTEPVVVASKSYAYTADAMEKSLHKALKEMKLDCIDIFLLHEQESHLTIKGHWEALQFLIRAKEKGLVIAVGISTHFPQAAAAAAEIAEIEIIHPIINREGVGLQNGGVEDMLEAVKKAYLNGTGIYAMKALGGGHLISKAREAFDFILKLPWIASTAVGMQSTAEVDINCCYFRRVKPPESLLKEVKLRTRRLHINDWCQGCGKCIEACAQKALYLKEGKIRVDPEKCVLCGYCGARCPLFCLKIV